MLDLIGAVVVWSLVRERNIGGETPVLGAKPV
jgi:hypothetical protein